MNFKDGVRCPDTKVTERRKLGGGGVGGGGVKTEFQLDENSIVHSTKNT